MHFWKVLVYFQLYFYCTSNGFNVTRHINSAVKTPILEPILPQRPFLTVWNIGTSTCKPEYNVNIDLSSFDIINNPNESFYGDNMLIFYSKQLGLYPYFNSSGYPVNGGIPQLGNISAHYEKCVKDIKQYIPDENYSGLVVIDWESWRPLWKRNGWGNGLIYQNASLIKVRKEHPSWSKKQVLHQAEEEFESAAKSYMSGTLNLAKLLRPKAAWGYYLFPDCYNYDKTGSDLTCHDDVVQDNNKIQWLFGSSNALYPSTYLGIWFKNQSRATEYVANRVLEARRVDMDINGTSIPIYVYNNLVYRETKEFLTYKDLTQSTGVAALLGASGVVFWCQWYLHNTKETCEKMKDYVENVLGPYVKLASDSAAECSLEVCYGHGRCVVVKSSMWSQKPTTLLKVFLQKSLPNYKDYEVSCQCYVGFYGNSCQHFGKNLY